MSSSHALLAELQNGKFDTWFAKLYGTSAVQKQRIRYENAIRRFVELYGHCEGVSLFSAPGRTEIGGNHTDHNHGRVLAASVNLDIIAVAASTNDASITVKSEGYLQDVINLAELAVQPTERNRSSSLIRGMVDGFVKNGYRIGGFKAYTTSNVLKGSGLSSSAAFEVLVGTILNHIYNGGTVDAVSIAKIAQYAENEHFGKPSGLMDQMASSVGGIIAIDFEDTTAPVIRTVDFDFAAVKHRLCIVDVGGNHANLTHEYAAITAEMKEIANALGVLHLRQTDHAALLPAIPKLREQYGDRAVLRALHFFSDNERVEKQVKALQAGNFEEFKQLVIESGHSSFEYLQNIHPADMVKRQEMSLALALAQKVLNGKGAWRVHGGGFGGTTQNFVPEDLVEDFTNTVETVFGKSNCHVLSIRPCGSVCLTAE